MIKIMLMSIVFGLVMAFVSTLDADYIFGALFITMISWVFNG